MAKSAIEEVQKLQAWTQGEEVELGSGEKIRFWHFGPLELPKIIRFIQELVSKGQNLLVSTPGENGQMQTQINLAALSQVVDEALMNEMTELVVTRSCRKDMEWYRNLDGSDQFAVLETFWDRHSAFFSNRLSPMLKQRFGVDLLGKKEATGEAETGESASSTSSNTATASPSTPTEASSNTPSE